MKKILITLILFIPLFGISQTVKNYQFEFTEVTSLGHSKPVVEILRDEFLVNPTYIDSTNVFTVPDTQYLNEIDLRDKLLPYGYTLTNFNLPETK